MSLTKTGWTKAGLLRYYDDTNKRKRPEWITLPSSGGLQLLANDGSGRGLI